MIPTPAPEARALGEHRRERLHPPGPGPLLPRVREDHARLRGPGLAGDRYAGEHAFKGRQTDRVDIDVPMAQVQQAGKANLVLERKGKGRLYYRIGMRYAPRDLGLKPADYGFTVTRTYQAMDHPDDVTRAKDGTWHIKAGARVRVRLTMVTRHGATTWPWSTSSPRAWSP